MNSIIVAMGEDRAIGKDNDIPWHLPEDFKRFKQITSGHPIVMGRRTFESMGKALPKRTNIVVTRNQEWSAENVEVASSVEEALVKARNAPGSEEVFLIGGTRVFEEALTLADRIYLTIVHGSFDADTFFPDKDLDDIFEMEKEFEGTSEKNPNLSFTYYLGRRKK